MHKHYLLSFQQIHSHSHCLIFSFQMKITSVNVNICGKERENTSQVITPELERMHTCFMCWAIAEDNSSFFLFFTNELSTAIATTQ